MESTLKKQYLDQLRLILTAAVVFDDKAWTDALSFFTVSCWKANDYIFHAGEKPEKAYFLVQGRGRYFYTSNDGKEKVKSIVRIGGVFASMSTLIDQHEIDLGAALEDQSVPSSEFVLLKFGEGRSF